MSLLAFTEFRDWFRKLLERAWSAVNNESKHGTLVDVAGIVGYARFPALGIRGLFMLAGACVWLIVIFRC